MFQAGSYELGDLSLTYTFPDMENLHALRPAPTFLLSVEDTSEEPFLSRSSGIRKGRLHTKLCTRALNSSLRLILMYCFVFPHTLVT